MGLEPRLCDVVVQVPPGVALILSVPWCTMVHRDGLLNLKRAQGIRMLVLIVLIPHLSLLILGGRGDRGAFETST